MTGKEEPPHQAMSSPGVSWRVVAWIALACNLPLASKLLFGAKSADPFMAVVNSMMGFTVVLLLAGLGILCGIAGVVTADPTDRRFVLILPVYSHIVFIMALLWTLMDDRKY